MSHLSEAEEFDALEQNLKSLKTGGIFYVPGEHDVISDNGALDRERFAKKAVGSGWYSFDKKGVHFVGLNNVLNIREGGLGVIGVEQLDWLKKDLEPLSSSTPIVVFAHIPLWAVYPQWGWGTDDAEQALGFLKRFGSVTVLNGRKESGRQHHFSHRNVDGVSTTRARNSCQTGTDEGRSGTTQFRPWNHGR